MQPVEAIRSHRLDRVDLVDRVPGRVRDLGHHLRQAVGGHSQRRARVHQEQSMIPLVPRIALHQPGVGRQAGPEVSRHWVRHTVERIGHLSMPVAHVVQIDAQENLFEPAGVGRQE